MSPVLPRIGVTRVADLTGLDRVGIPVVDTVMPRSRDIISTYGGKGVTLLAARVSAAMEAVERFCAAEPVAPDEWGSLNELRRRGQPVLDPGEVNLAAHPDFDDDTAIGWLWGHELVSSRAVLVASDQAADSWPPLGRPVNLVASSNGLAAGMTEREAVLHGLYEVIERDAWTHAELLSVRLPRLLARGGVDDPERVPRVLVPIDVSGAGELVRGLVERFDVAGVDLDLCLVDWDLRVPTVMATTTTRDGSGLSGSHLGLGTDADPEVAVVRALTEVAQSRAGDVAAAREDVSPADVVVPSWLHHTQRARTVPTRLRSARSVTTSEMAGYASDDLAEDLRRTVDRVSSAGLDRIIVVDLSRADVPVVVCRVIVPGAESWGADASKLGARALRAWNDTVRPMTSSRVTRDGARA